MRREEGGETRCKNETTRVVLSKCRNCCCMLWLLTSNSNQINGKFYVTKRCEICRDKIQLGSHGFNQNPICVSSTHSIFLRLVCFNTIFLTRIAYNLSVIIEFYESYFRNSSITKLFVFHNLDVLWTYLQHHLQNSNNEQNEVNVECRCRTRVEEGIPLHRR